MENFRKFLNPDEKQEVFALLNVALNRHVIKLKLHVIQQIIAQKINLYFCQCRNTLVKCFKWYFLS